MLSLKHWALVGGAVACLGARSALSAPWVNPGDAKARHELQKRVDRGDASLTTSTWPIMWPAINASSKVANADSSGFGAPLGVRLSRLKANDFANGSRGVFRVSGASAPRLVQGFEPAVQNDGELTLGYELQQGHWALGVNVTGVADPEDDESFRLDGSYLAGTLGNLVIGVGAIDRWWGPGWQSSLILSNNARPVPSVWVNRKTDAEPETSWLKWIGPWNFTAFVGQLEKERAVSEPALIGMRFTMRPFQGLDIGLSRTIMFAGEGRPNNGSALWDALIGRDNSQDGGDNDPGNQLGSIDFRYGFALGDQAGGLYAQMMGEDEAGSFPGKKSWLFGLDWTTSLFGSDQQWFAEYVNTLADDFLGDALPNISYEHFNYRTGYRYYGRNMAASVDGDAIATTLGVYHFLPQGTTFSASLTYAELNRDGVSRAVRPNPKVNYVIPALGQELFLADFGVKTPLPAGELSLNVQVADDRIELVGGKLDRVAASATWQYQF